MATPSRPDVKRSVRIDAEVFDTLSPERRLEYVVALNAQRELVAEWEHEFGPFSGTDLAPFLDAASRAQAAQHGLDHARNHAEVSSPG